MVQMTKVSVINKINGGIVRIWAKIKSQHYSSMQFCERADHCIMYLSYYYYIRYFKTSTSKIFLQFCNSVLVMRTMWDGVTSGRCVTRYPCAGVVSVTVIPQDSRDFPARCAGEYRVIQFWHFWYCNEYANFCHLLIKSTWHHILRIYFCLTLIFTDKWFGQQWYLKF